MGTKKIGGGDGNVLKLDCGTGCITVNSLNRHFIIPL